MSSIGKITSDDFSMSVKAFEEIMSQTRQHLAKPLNGEIVRDLTRDKPGDIEVDRKRRKVLAKLFGSGTFAGRTARDRSKRAFAYQILYFAKATQARGIKEEYVDAFNRLTEKRLKRSSNNYYSLSEDETVDVINKLLGL